MLAVRPKGRRFDQLGHLLQPNEDAWIDVFMHSWSPDAEPMLTQLWGPMLVSQQHEPTRYVDGTSRLLAFQCGVTATNCARTASQLLSIYKALALKREHELGTGSLYRHCRATRHQPASPVSAARRAVAQRQEWAA